MQSDFTQLHRDVVFGRSNGKIIWQPRIGAWLEDRLFDGRGLPAPFTGMDLPAVHRDLNCSARLYRFWNPSYKMHEHPAVKVYEEDIDSRDVRTVIETPVGRQIMISRRTASSPVRIRIKGEIESPEEMKVAIWRVENTTWSWDEAMFQKISAQIGDLGAPTIYLPRVNIQNLYINSMGVEKALYMLYDHPDLVEAYFKALDDCHDRLIDIINPSPIEIINFGDNIHCGTLTPQLFCKYVLPAYHRRCDKLHQAGKFVSSHWDGDTKTLLPFAKETGLDGIEAITPVPQGDVTIEEVKKALGDDLFLLDGLPAILFDEDYSFEQLADYAKRIIDLFAPKLVFGISDELSSTGDIERVRRIGKLVDEYNNR